MLGTCFSDFFPKVQSGTYKAPYLREKIFEFMASMEKFVEEMTDEAFTDYRKGSRAHLVKLGFCAGCPSAIPTDLRAAGAA